MTDDELVEVLRKFETTRVEKLNDNSKRLFYAIMKIADERDELKEENQRLKENNQAMQEEMARTWKKYDKVNNVLNELEKWLKSNDEHFAEAIPFRETLRKLKELKESDKE